MGTRSLTVVKDDQLTDIIVLYRQYDGHPDAHGLALAEFLLPIRITNGICGDNKNTANGMGCLAAQIVAHFKVDVGGFYLYPSGTRDVGEEYLYIVRLRKDNTLNISAYDKQEQLTTGSIENYISEWRK